MEESCGADMARSFVAQRSTFVSAHIKEQGK